MQVALVRISRDGRQQEVTLSHDQVMVGRQEGCQLRVVSPKVSRRHCRIVQEDDGLMVQDLGSSNGTFVNGERVESRKLGAGDVLTVGSMVFVVRIDGEPGAIESDEALKTGRPAEAAAENGRPAPAESEPKTGLKSLTSADPDDSSVVDFDFDFDDEEDDEQPPL